jgi:hypothetical protein
MHFSFLDLHRPRGEDAAPSAAGTVRGQRDGVERRSRLGRRLVPRRAADPIETLESGKPPRRRSSGVRRRGGRSRCSIAAGNDLFGTHQEPGDRGRLRAARWPDLSAQSNLPGRLVKLYGYLRSSSDLVARAHRAGATRGCRSSTVPVVSLREGRRRAALARAYVRRRTRWQQVPVLEVPIDGDGDALRVAVDRDPRAASRTCIPRRSASCPIDRVPPRFAPARRAVELVQRGHPAAAEPRGHARRLDEDPAGPRSPLRAPSSSTSRASPPYEDIALPESLPGASSVGDLHRASRIVCLVPQVCLGARRFGDRRRRQVPPASLAIDRRAATRPACVHRPPVPDQAARRRPRSSLTSRSAATADPRHRHEESHRREAAVTGDSLRLEAMHYYVRDLVAEPPLLRGACWTSPRWASSSAGARRRAASSRASVFRGRSSATSSARRRWGPSPARAVAPARWLKKPPGRGRHRSSSRWPTSRRRSSCSRMHAAARIIEEIQTLTRRARRRHAEAPSRITTPFGGATFRFVERKGYRGALSGGWSVHARAHRVASNTFELSTTSITSPRTSRRWRRRSSGWSTCCGFERFWGSSSTPTT